MVKNAIKITGSVLVSLLLFFAFLYFNDDIGISKNSLEKDARSSSKIEADWHVAMDTSDTMSAMVFYPKDKSDHSFDVYVNRPGLSFGYFFRGGGDIIEVENYVAEFSVEGYSDRAFISLNAQQIVKVEIDNGNSIETIEIDSTKPFAIVLPQNIGSVTFFDVNGDIVDTMNHPL